MARIPKEELERLKRDVDLVELARARGIELEERGSELVGLCPFHEEETPSFRISTVKNLFHCFGCGAKGSVLDFVMKTEGVSLPHAVAILRKGWDKLDGELKYRRPLKRSNAQKLPVFIEPEAGDGELYRQVVDYYHQTLKESPEAIEYLKNRGLDPDKVVDRFQLGFANRTLGYHIPHSRLKDGKAIRGRLAELGIIKTTGHELLAGSLVIPVFDGGGEVVQMYGRKITPNLRAGTPLHLYLPGPRRGVFNLDALRESKEIILCEALIDALTFFSAGFQNVTTAYGINGFTDEMLEAFKAYGTERLLIAYDCDERGEKAAAKLAERLAGEGISCFRVKLPHNMDVNEYAVKVKPARKALGVLLRASEYMAGPLKTLGVVGACAAEQPEEPMSSRVSEPEKASSSLAAASEPSGEVKTQEIIEPSASESAKPEAGASPVAPLPAAEVAAEVRDHEVNITLGDRRWRVRGLARNLSYEHMRINLLVACGEHFHVDSLDLYSARQRGVFLKQATEELQVKADILKKDLGKVLLKLEELQDQQIKKQLEPSEMVVELSDEEQRQAMALLKDSKLLERISADLETCGLVGEHTNKLVAYLAAVSRKLAKPLGVMVQSSSAAGKSALMDGVLSFCPDEERVQYSAMTGQSLFYMGEADLKHKVLAIAEEEGADRASYALKLLQSEGKLSIASTGKDPKSGRLTTHEYHVEGPAAILMTTTAIDLDEELLNRCVVLAVDESRLQTEAIHRMQREDRTLAGLERNLARSDLRKLHQNAQRLLKPLYVVNPFSPELTFLSNTTRTRRDHLKYLVLIDAIALLHQHQRKVTTGSLRGRRIDYIEVQREDIATANRLASEVLGRTLDELPPQTRRLLLLIEEMVRSHCEAHEIERQQCLFSRRDVREYTGLGNTQLRLHLDRLVEMEYLLVHRGRRGQSFVYELLYEGQGKDGQPFVLGLINADKLNHHRYDANLAGSEGKVAGSKRPQNAPKTGGWRGGLSADSDEDGSEITVKPPKTAYRGHQQDRAVVVVAASRRSE